MKANKYLTGEVAARMNVIFGYLLTYYRSVNRLAFLLTSLLTAAIILINYTIGIEERIITLPSYFYRFTGFFLLFAFTFSAAWCIQFFFSKETIFIQKFFTVLLLAGPVIFAAKVTLDWLSAFTTQFFPMPWNKYWDIILNWPLKCLLVIILMLLIARWGKYKRSGAGIRFRGFTIKPYLVLLLCMTPLVILAATRPDFQQVYPKVQRVAFINEYVQHPVPWKLLFELSYGIDFITIELFFRGFLVLLFVRYAGKNAILPMAAFYCSIHFGKPLFECITSYFGGIILGVIVYHTRNIWGGLVIHLGIAWLMELAGYLSHLLKDH